MKDSPPPVPGLQALLWISTYLWHNKFFRLTLAASCVTGTFILIIFYSAYGIYRDKLPFSLNKIFWIFCLFFMGLAPLLQYSSGSRPFPWVPDMGARNYLETNLLILSCMIVFSAVYAAQKKRDHPMVVPGNPAVDILKKSFLVPGTFIFAAALLAQFWLSGSLWYRSAAETGLRITDSSLQLLADKSLKGIVLCYCLAAIRLYRQKAISSTHIIIILAVAVLTNFPTAIPRYWLAGFYIGIGITYYIQVFLKKPRSFDLLLISGLTVLFPLLTLARLKKEEMLAARSYPLFTQLTRSFCGQDFDAYASLQHTLGYVQTHGMLWGSQLRTTLLFFIPRRIWQGKSVGSGSLVNPPKPGSDFSNFSSPLFAEGYLDFHFAGALLLTALCAWLWGRYDRCYWHTARGGFLHMMYPAYLGLAFFMLRGDLLSSFAYTAGIATAAWLFYRTLAVTRKKGTL